MTMLCSDDKHPDELFAGHINALVRRAVERGIDVFDALRAACITPVEHYGLDVGQLRVGDPADFIEVDSLTDFNVLRTWIDGQLVAENGTDDDSARRADGREQVRADARSRPTTLPSPRRPIRRCKLQVIEALDGQLITNRLEFPVQVDQRGRARAARARHPEAGRRESLPQSAAGDRVHQELRPASAARWPRASPTIRTM